MRRALIASGVLVLTVLAVFVASTGGAQQTARESGSEIWVGTWAAAQAPAGGGKAGEGFTDQTVRMTIRTSVGGDALRVRLSNNFGTQNLTVGRATVAVPVANDSPQIDPKSLRELTFGGAQGTSIPKGGQVVSDPVDMRVGALQELTISVYLPEATGPATFHFVARETSFYGDGDQAAKPEFTVKDTRPYWFFLSGVDVRTTATDGSVVMLGDSIADGFGSTLGVHRRWPDYLAARLENTAVLNKSLSGNAIAHDGSEIKLPELGVNALARLHRDVMGEPGAHTIIIALGINDVQFHDDDSQRVIAGLRQLAAQARMLGLRVIGCTLMPFKGYSTWTPGKEYSRSAINEYLRDSKLFDEIVDFDKLLRDPDDPAQLMSKWDSGDHIHPNDAGYEAMAAAIPVEWIERA